MGINCGASPEMWPSLVSRDVRTSGVITDRARICLEVIVSNTTFYRHKLDFLIARNNPMCYKRNISKKAQQRAPNRCVDVWLCRYRGTIRSHHLSWSITQFKQIKLSQRRFLATVSFGCNSPHTVRLSSPTKITAIPSFSEDFVSTSPLINPRFSERRTRFTFYL